MHDGITFEQLGKPAIVVCTTPFQSNAKNLARVMNLSQYPVVFVDHPIGSLDTVEIESRAKSVYREATGILLGS